MQKLKHNYIILDDVYFPYPIELHEKIDYISFDKVNNEIVMDMEQLTRLIKDLIKDNTIIKGGDVNNVI